MKRGAVPFRGEQGLRAASRLAALDEQCLLALHGTARCRAVLTLMRAASRLGDGIVWYVLIVFLALEGELEGVPCAVQMIGTAAAGLLWYRWLKRRTCRPRPYTCLDGVTPHGRALDEFSFPSGHTLHAVALTIVLAAWFPAVALALAPLVVLIALSRVVLGLHYPSDVLAGAFLGALVAFASLAALAFLPITS